MATTTKKISRPGARRAAPAGRPPEVKVNEAECSRCRLIKSWQNFHANNSRPNVGLSYWCKDCTDKSRGGEGIADIGDVRQAPPKVKKAPAEALAFDEHEVVAFLVDLVNQLRPQVAALEEAGATQLKVIETLRADLERKVADEVELRKKLSEGKELLEHALDDNEELSDKVKAFEIELAKVKQELDIKCIRLAELEGTGRRMVTGDLAREVAGLGFKGSK